MIASNDHGQPSLAPRCTCGQLLILPPVYLDMMFSDPDEQKADTGLEKGKKPEICFTA